MIRKLLSFIFDRHMRKGFHQLEQHTRASTKLSPAYERRRLREIRKAQAMFGEASHG